MADKAVFTTARSTRHQNDALAVAPEGLAVTMLRSPERADLASALADATILVSERSGVIDAGLLSGAPELRLILRLGELTHDIDLEAARAAGVVVCRREQEGVLRVAEFCMLQMLALQRRLRESEDLARAAAETWVARRVTDENSFAFNWTRRSGLGGLHGRNVGILGFGEIGVALARRLQGWGVSLRYNRRNRLPEAVEAELGLTWLPAETLLAQADVVVCLLPFTEQTHGWLDAEHLGAMKPGALLVSAGSGGIIDEAALADAVASGHLAGAALDTFATEPLESENPLVVLAGQGVNLLLTPHVAGGAPLEANTEFAAMWQPVRDFMVGCPPQGRLV